MKEKETNSSKKSLKEKGNKTFPIVGLGASAGGLEALERFFSHMPSESNMAFVIIQHLDPARKSFMDSLLKKYTEMNIFQVKDGMKIEPNCVYLNPPNRNVAIMNRTLHLISPVETHRVSLPIDYFFSSLSEDQGEKAICIILSGTGTDGTLGLRSIKGSGGMTMVQEEKQAKYAGMPRSAIDTGLVDYILPVENMPGTLLKYVKHPFIEGPKKAVTAEEQFLNNVNKIFLLIRSNTGHDFTNYKQNTIRRRIERRMAVHQIDRIEHYVRYLQQTPVEVETLFKDMLITVTNFFRDPEAFDVLKEKVLPGLLEHKQPETPVRVWVPGCATGEEAYSIAMLLVETMERLKKRFNIQIFATDIDAEAIEHARMAVYPESIAADVSQERLKHFFINEDSSYRIKKMIREMVVFATQNLIKDPAFSRLDLVSCRNLLIYMDSVLQKKILPLFHYTLNQDGILFLGTSESIGEFSDLFSTIDTKWKIFKRKGAVLEKALEHPAG
jgi:two-component system CheB/CheR fusion protein